VSATVIAAVIHVIAAVILQFERKITVLNGKEQSTWKE